MKLFVYGFMILLLLGLVSAADIMVFQGQYHEGDEFLVGKFDFTFSVYDAKTGGNLVYSETKKLTTGVWGQWRVELEGISAAASDVNKDYFMEIAVDGEIQGLRRKITQFPYLRKDVNEFTTGVIFAKSFETPNGTVGGYGTSSGSSGSGTTNIASLTLLPSTPNDPSTGTIYFDLSIKKIRFYDGTQWQNLTFESALTSVSGTVDKVCKVALDCPSWGDCINGKKTRTCKKTFKDCKTEDLIKEKKCKVQTSQDNDENEEESSSESSESSESAISSSESSETEEETSSEETSEETEIETEEEASSTESAEEEAEEQQQEEEEEPEEEEKEEKKGKGKGNPEQLFDITFNLEEYELKNSRDLITWVTLESFGTVETPTRLTYVIKDSLGQEVDKKIDEIKVLTENRVIREFNDLELENGDYTVHLTLEYGGVTDNFYRGFIIKKGFFRKIFEWFGKNN